MGKSFRRDDDYANKYRKNDNFKKKFEKKNKKKGVRPPSFNQPVEGFDVPFVSDDENS